MPRGYTFNKAMGLYRDSKTREFVPAERVSGWIEKATQQAQRNLESIARELQGGKINTAEWVLRSGTEIKNMHRAIGMAAGGGREAMTQADWGFVGSRVRDELRYLNRFASELENIPRGATLTDAFVTRAGSYAHSGYTTYEKGVRRRILRDGVADEEENVLEPGAEHCDDCLEETDRGRVPVGELLPVGDRECGVRCRCRIVYFKGGVERSAPAPRAAVSSRTAPMLLRMLPDRKGQS